MVSGRLRHILNRPKVFPLNLNLRVVWALKQDGTRGKKLGFGNKNDRGQMYWPICIINIFWPKPKHPNRSVLPIGLQNPDVSVAKWLVATLWVKTFPDLSFHKK